MVFSIDKDIWVGYQISPQNEQERFGRSIQIRGHDYDIQHEKGNFGENRFCMVISDSYEHSL